MLVIMCLLLFGACGTKEQTNEQADPTLEGDEKVIYEARKETDAKIEEIINSENLKLPNDAKVYYVSEYGDDDNDGLSEDSPWCSLDKVNETKLSKGSYVCFERGNVWRGQLIAQEGVTYTAYGEGDKPKFYGSPEDGADPSMWTQTQYENVWRYENKFDYDVGGIVFDNDSKVLGSKVCLQSVETLRKLEEERNVDFDIDGYGKEAILNQVTMTEWKNFADMTDLQFYHNCYGVIYEGVDIADGYLYLYSKENPGERFESIEFLIQKHVIRVGSEAPIADVTLNNLCIKYTGAHGISAINVTNFECSDLEVGDIGGSLQSKPVVGSNIARYGNGIQVWESCDGWTVKDCYIYNCYDAGVTPQTLNTGIPKNQHNINIKNNVIEYCNYCVEYFCGWKENCKQTYSNFVIEGNYMWYSGQGICKTRLHFNEAAFIKSWRYSNVAEGFVIRDNVMIDARAYVMETMWTQNNEDGSSSAPLIQNNIIAAKEDINYSSCQLWTGAKWEKVKESYVQAYNESFEELLNSELGSGNQCLFIE